MEKELKEIIEKLGQTFEEFKAANDKRLEELKKGKADAVVEEKIAKIDAELEKLSQKKDALEKRADELEKKTNRPRLGSKGANGVELTEEQIEHKAAFAGFMRKGIDAGLREIEAKAMAVGSQPDGGYLVPADTSGRIIQRLFDTSPIRQIANIVTIGVDALEGIRDTDEAGTGGWVAEQSTRSTSGTPQLGKWRIEAFEQYAQPAVTQKLLDDAVFDVEAWLGRKVADKLSRTENTAFVAGTGAGQPRGFTTYPTAATSDASRAWGTLEHVATGNSGDFATSNPADILFDLVGAFKEGYLANARWVTRREVITKIRKFKDQHSAYLWQPGLQQGVPDMLLGYPITRAQDMPALAANSLSLAFGNFAEGYQIVDRQDVRVLRDPYTNKPFVNFYVTKRVGGDVVQFEMIKFVKFG